MFKKTLISLAVASSVGLTGCFDSGSTGANANPEYLIEDTTIDKSIVRPVYNPNPIAAEPQFPVNSDLLLLLGATQSANYDFTGLSSGSTPADDAINDLSGFSTSSPLTLNFDGSLNPQSVAANATVFLVPLKVPPLLESAPNALPNTNPSTIDPTDPFDTAVPTPNFRADVVSVDGGQNNAIRIVPLTPLEPGQKYLVVITNDVLGANGKPIERSVQDVALADGVLGNPALENVKNLLQRSDQLANGFLATLGVENTPESALAYSFTTNDDGKVLQAMFSPTVFGAALGEKITAAALLEQGKADFPTLNFSELSEELLPIIGTAIEVAEGNVAIGDLPAEDQAQIAPYLEILGATLGAPGDISAAITAAVQSGAIHLPQPRPNIFFNDSDPENAIPDGPIDVTDLPGVGPLALADSDGKVVPASGQVEVYQGAIRLPYFQGIPEGEDGSAIVDSNWTGNETLEEELNESLNVSFSFLRDLDGTFNVNGYFPFPQQTGNVTVPIIAIKPTPAACAGGVEGVTIFQHGITGDRSQALLAGISLAQEACQAVIAIDQPLHGLGGSTVGSIPGLSPLTETALTAAVVERTTAIANLPPEAPLTPQQREQLTRLAAGTTVETSIGERHFGFTDGGTLEPVVADAITDVESGSLFINPLNMMNSRDNLRQGVIDLINLAASVQTFDVDGDLQPDFAPVQLVEGEPTRVPLPVSFVGHSLGGISGTVFASLVNGQELFTVPVGMGTAEVTLSEALNSTLGAQGISYPSLASVSLHDTGGQLTRLIDNSPAFSGDILTGLSNLGVLRGSSRFESFFYVFQSIIDGTDPINYAQSLGNSTTNLLITEVVGDQVVPNEANVNPLLSDTFGQAFSAPLAGTEPLMALIDLGASGGTLADGSGLNIIDSNNAGTALPAAVFFGKNANPCLSANHSTYVAPVLPESACGPLNGSVYPTGPFADGFVNSIDSFDAMQAITAEAIGGGPLTSPAAELLGASETLPNALDQDE